MENINENLELIKQFMDMLEKHFGYNCEVVLHDFTQGYDHTIVDIRNGHITGRHIGGCATNLGLDIMKGNREGGGIFNYVTYTGNGKILKSSSLHFNNSKDELIGSLCINMDITDSVKFENFLKEFNGNSIVGEPVNEFFVSDVHELLDEFIRQAFQISNKKAEDMTRDDKMEFIRFLDEKGSFIISKSGEKVCELLNISKFTFYNYLDMIRKEKPDTEEE